VAFSFVHRAARPILTQFRWPMWSAELIRCRPVTGPLRRMSGPPSAGRPLYLGNLILAIASAGLFLVLCPRCCVPTPSPRSKARRLGVVAVPMGVGVNFRRHRGPSPDGEGLD